MAEHLSGVVYLDNMASAPLRPIVAAAMAPWLSARGVGNPHADHAPGRAVRLAVETAQAQVAEMLGCKAAEVVFTSGATEANNLALQGALRPGGVLIISAIEHPSVLETAAALETAGTKVTRVAVDGAGVIDVDAFTAAVAAAPDGSVASLMAVNNETGVKQPLADVAAVCGQHGVTMHTDATQALTTGMIGADMDLVSLSGHKLGGPMGIGALLVRDGLALTPLMHGGAQQYGLRPGTVPVALVVGLGAACQGVAAARVDEKARLGGLTERLWDGLSTAVPGLERNGVGTGCLNVTFPGVDAAAMLHDLSGDLAAATGAACATGKPGPSHVLVAMGRTPEQAHGNVRFSLGWQNTADDVDFVVSRIGAWLEVGGKEVG